MIKKPTPIDGKVFMTVQGGPYQEPRTREVTQVEQPLDLTISLARERISWALDLSQADPIQTLEWVRADMAGRIIAALMHGRPVRFNQRTFMVTNPTQLEEVMGQVEDTISESGFNVFVESDDESGVSIGIHSKEASKN